MSTPNERRTPGKSQSLLYWRTLLKEPTSVGGLNITAMWIDQADEVTPEDYEAIKSFAPTLHIIRTNFDGESQKTK